MKIDSKFSPVPRQTPSAGVDAVDGRSADSRRPASHTPAAGSRSDSVQLSQRGREMSGTGGLAPERLQQIRSRIESGFYDDARVADVVARRMRATGDV